MLKKFALKGFLLGIQFGLVVTLFDGLVMRMPNIAIPYSYPVLLLGFNIPLWAVVGLLFSIGYWIFFSGRAWAQKKKDFYFAVFALLFFVIIYGILGSVFLPISPRMRNAFPVYDHHLSFLWVAVIFLFLFLYFNKKTRPRESVPNFYMMEMAACVLIFQFCSNIHFDTVLSDIYNENLTLFEGVGVQRKGYLNILYTLGLLLIYGGYFLWFFKCRAMFKRFPNRKIYHNISLLFLVVAGLLAGLFAWQQRAFFNEQLAGINTNQKTNRTTEGTSPVILIVLDTVRADNLAVYGGDVKTENLQGFSNDALVFEKCIASSSWTLPSHASLFTGLYPREHGAHYLADSKKKTALGFPVPQSLSKDFLTLAEVFENAGYSTYGVASNYALLSPEFNMDQGFQFFDNRESIGGLYNRLPFRPVLHLFCNITNFFPKYILPYRSADDITDESIELLENKTSTPAFLFVNFNDAHDPYRPPRPFNMAYPYTTVPYVFNKFKRYFFPTAESRYDRIFWNTYRYSQYKGEISYLDQELGRFLDRLKKIGIYDSSLIIITSDHGELFGENEMFGHETPMYEGVVWVPLMIKYPYSKRLGRYAKKINFADIFTTILSVCDLPAPNNKDTNALEGISPPVVGELYRYKGQGKDRIGKHQILYEGKYKYMRYEYVRSPELYDMERDPKEQENLIRTLPELASKMEQKLDDWQMEKAPRYTSGKEEAESISEKAVEGLRALGYVD